MRTVNIYKLTPTIFLAMVIFISTLPVFSYPPDNAAVLYYRACLLYQSDSNSVGEMDKSMVNFLWKGETGINEKIKKFVEQSKYVINILLTASDVPNCDWGFDYSQGLSIPLPSLSTLKRLVNLVLADAKIHAAESDYHAALERCLSVQKMGRHISNGPIVSHLVGLSFDKFAYNSFTDILAKMPEDLETLIWLKKQLADIAARPFSAKTALVRETEMTLAAMQIEKIDEIQQMLSDCADESARDRLETSTEQFLENSKQCYKNCMVHIQTLLDMPYPQAYVKLNEMEKSIVQDAKKKENSDLIFTAILMPALGKFYSYTIEQKTHSNVLCTAVDIYIVKAKTGQLPDTLPAGSPLDLFSGKTFQYEKTDNSFILRCQGKNLDKDKIHEYEFKVKK